MKGWLLRGCSLRRRRKTEGEGGSERVVTKEGCSLRRRRKTEGEGGSERVVTKGVLSEEEKEDRRRRRE